MSLNDNIKQIKEEFPRLTDRDKYEAFTWLSRIKVNDDGAFAILDLLAQYANSGTIPAHTLLGINIYPEQADLYFPELLKYVSIPNFGHPIYSKCSFLLSWKKLSPTRLESHLDILLSAYRDLKNQWQQTNNSSDSYYQIYFLLEIFGYFSKSDVESELYAALDLYTEVGFKYQAIGSLWRLGKPIDDKYIVELIADDSMRWSMFWRLQERDELDLFPEQYRTAEAFARASIVSTIDANFAANVGKLELLEVIQINSQYKEDNGQYYIYRVLSDFGQGDEKYWVLGWAGPVHEDFDFFKTKMQSPIFNRPGVGYEAWDKIPPKELVMQYLETFHKSKQP